MKKKRILVALLIGATCSSLSAFAESGRLRVGLTVFSDDVVYLENPRNPIPIEFKAGNEAPLSTAFDRIRNELLKAGESAGADATSFDKAVLARKVHFLCDADFIRAMTPGRDYGDVVSSTSLRSIVVETIRSCEAVPAKDAGIVDSGKVDLKQLNFEKRLDFQSAPSSER